MPQLFESKPILRADSEIEQLDAVFRLCGSPTPDAWPSVTALPLYATCKVRRDYPRQIAERFSRRVSVVVHPCVRSFVRSVS
jgi:cyclin-dependent kinase 12/13